MGTPYLGEIRIFPFPNPPRGWAQCNGQSVPINQNQALFSVIGTTYGGDGVTNFLLPNMVGCTAVHPGGGIVRGQRGGEAAHTLTFEEMPDHSHTLYGANTQADSPLPGGNLLAAAQQSGMGTWYSGTPANPTTLGSSSIGNAGGGQSHTNLQPFLALNVCIAVQGIFPTRD